jgi:hypothetical protein
VVTGKLNVDGTTVRAVPRGSGPSTDHGHGEDSDTPLLTRALAIKVHNAT